ncbi:MAG: hypothetical protein RBQ97_07475 [Acholeplasma sp.]|jgi:hypothetical protein|nr:hypothetical protein [Acholeplasma sp.]
MAIIKDEKYIALKKLYQYHQDRYQYDHIFHMILPKSIYLSFINHYQIDNAKKTKIFLSLLKALIFGLFFFLIFSWANITDIQLLMIYHLIFLWVYIISIAYQVYSKNSLSKNDMLMLLIGRYRKQLFIDTIKDKFIYSYFTSLMPLTLIPLIVFSISEQSPISYMMIFGFLLFQVAGYTISKFVVVNLYKLKYIAFRHSFFKDFFVSIAFTIISAVIYLICLYPMFFIISDESIHIVYPVLTLYVIIMTLLGRFIFNKWIVKFVDRNLKSILYPKAMSLKQSMKAKFFHSDSIALKGLDKTEKAIAIKDQKMFKRSNRKEYYGSYFYGIVLVFSGFPYVSKVQETDDMIGLITMTMIFTGIAFTIHMIQTSMMGKHISYTSERSLVLTYHRLSVPIKKIFNAKLRLFTYMLLPIIALDLSSFGLLFIHFSLEKLWILFFGIFYFLGITRLKLRNYLHLDTQNKKTHVNALDIETSNLGSSLAIGLFFIFIIPLGFSWFAQQMNESFGMTIVYIMMIVFNLIIWIINMINDIHIKKIHNEVVYND